VAIPEEKIQMTMELLTTWNPLGDKAKRIRDLGNYRTEAIDILFNLQLADPSANPARIVQRVLNQAFDLSLSLEKCAEVGRQIGELFR